MPSFPPGANVKGGTSAAPVHRESARAFYAPLLPLVLQLHREGKSLRQIARELDARGIPTRYEFRRWAPEQVRRVLARALAKEASQKVGDVGAGGPAAELVERCRALGHRLAVEDGEVIVYRTAAGVPATDALLDELTAHEPEVIRLLRAGAELC